MELYRSRVIQIRELSGKKNPKSVYREEDGTRYVSMWTIFKEELKEEAVCESRDEREAY